MASDPSEVPRLLAPFGSARQADSAVSGTWPGPAASSLASGVLGACVEGLTLRDALRLSLDFLKFIRTKLDASHLIHREARPEDRDVEFVRFALERILKEEDSKNS